MRILLIRQGAIGDIVVTLPTLEILRRNYIDTHIEAIGNPDYWEIAHKRYYLDAISKAESALVSELYAEGGQISKEVSNYFSSFDLIIGYMSDPDGVVTENLKKTGANRVVTCPPFPKGDDLHAADYTALILRGIGIEVNPPLFPMVYLNEEDLDFARRFLFSIEFNSVEAPLMAPLQSEPLPDLANKPFVAIHPRTFGIKGLSIEKFVNIGKWIETALGRKAIWIMGVAEEENIEKIKSHFPSSPLLFSCSLPKVAAVLSLCQLYIGCDTGISHLAAAVAAPVIALFGPTNPNVWGPRGKNVFILKADQMSQIKEDMVKDLVLNHSESADLEEPKISHI